MSEPVTAETITNKQIRELLDDREHRSSAIVALTPPGSFEREAARARCAAAWNARQGKESK